MQRPIQQKVLVFVIGSLMALTMAPSALHSQSTPPPPPGGFRGGPGGPGGGAILGFGCPGNSRVVTNAPYSATVTEHHVQLLYPSGTREENTSTETVFRDAAGDTYRQSEVTFMGQMRDVICINLASGDSYVLDPAKKTARHSTRRPVNFANRGGGNNPNRGSNNNANALPLNSAPQEVQNDLGFGCSTVVGTQVTRGQAPHQMQSVRWFCPALRIDLYSQTIDQRGETSTTVVLNSNSAPSFDPGTFLSGYTVTNENPRGRGPRRGSPPPQPPQQ